MSQLRSPKNSEATSFWIRQYTHFKHHQLIILHSLQLGICLHCFCFEVSIDGFCLHLLTWGLSTIPVHLHSHACLCYGLGSSSLFSFVCNTCFRFGNDEFGISLCTVNLCTWINSDANLLPIWFRFEWGRDLWHRHYACLRCTAVLVELNGSRPSLTKL